MCVAIPYQVVRLWTDGVEILDGEATRMVTRAGLPDLQPGDFVLVHAGLAIERLTADEAADLLALQSLLDDSVALDDLLASALAAPPDAR